MTVLEDYTQFNGQYWETGSVRNVLDYQGIKAPHTGEPYSEAMLMGISGGAVMAYFTFQWEGADPQARILTRNTFDPMNTFLSRLGVVQEVQQTGKAEKGKGNLIDTLADGRPAIVWADMWKLPYNALPDNGMWGTMPIVVYGYDEQADTAYISDRARVPLTVTAEQLQAARARVKKDKFRVLTLDMPDHDKLAAAVSAGIWDCINLYTEKPPKGAKKNWGLQAFQTLHTELTKQKGRGTWANEFPAGLPLYSALTWFFSDIMTFGKEGRAERDVYAQFLDEASAVLEKPDLQEVASLFRQSGERWNEFADALFPDAVPLLREAKELMLRRKRLFMEQGSSALDEIRQINTRRDEIRTAASDDFPLDEAGIVALREGLAEKLDEIRLIEEEAIIDLKSVMAS